MMNTPYDLQLMSVFIRNMNCSENSYALSGSLEKYTLNLIVSKKEMPCTNARKLR